MHIDQLRNNSILIMGYGKEGKSAHAFLKKHLPSNSVIEWTDQSIDSDYLSRQHDYDIIIKTPGIPPHLITKPYTTATNIFFAHTQNPIIGVTGSKGKSTTSSLIHHIMQIAGKSTHLVGNIGNPALTTLMEDNVKEGDIFIYELSSYMLQDLTYSPHVGIITSLFPDHIDYHRGIEAYYAAKYNIVKNMRASDYFIFQETYPLLKKLSTEILARPIPCSNTPLPLKIEGDSTYW